MQHCPSSEANSNSGGIPQFYDIEGSLQCLKQPTSCSCVEPNESTQGPVITFKIHFKIILPSVPRSSMLSLSLYFPIKTWYALFLSP
jgi:hypothetical protein